MTAWVCFGFCRGSAFGFFWLRRIGVLADRRHHGEGKHYQGNMAMPSMPGSALVVIEPELVFRGLKAVLDRPPMAFDRHQRFDGCCGWTPGGEEGEVPVAAGKAANLEGERPLPSIARIRTASISDARGGNKPCCART